MDWLLVAIASAVFVWTATVAQWPSMNLNWWAVYALLAVGLALLVIAAVSLWKTTRFN